MFKRLYAALACLFLTTAGLAQSATYTNPVWNTDFPDPCIIKVGEVYYAYGTQGSTNGKNYHIRVMHSTDLVHWTGLSEALPKLAAWDSASTSTWAPHVVAYKHRYYLYYASNHKSFTAHHKQGMGIGIAIAAKPEGPFIPQDSALLYAEGFGDLDPMLYIDEETNKKYLFWGSGKQPIRGREMDDDLLHFKAGSQAIDLWKPNDKPYEQLIEAPWVIKKYGAYYLFASGNNCCDSAAHYAVLVARSDNALGPYQMMSDALSSKDDVILELNDRWLAPGHNSIITDNEWDEWIVYHAYDLQKKAAGTNGGRELLIDKIVWKNEWPSRITPSKTPQPVPR